MEDIIDIIVTETTNLIEITSQPTDEIIDVNIIDNREDVTLNVTPTLVEININSLTGNFGILWGEIEGTLSNQTDLQNALNLKADLVDGKVPSSQLPSYVDDVVEVANYAALPVTGEVGKIYITLDTNYIYRWTGSVYVEIKDSSAVWGAITGTLSNQTDLQNALNAKDAVLTFSSPLSRSTNTVSIPAATTLVNGYLTSTDWTTFNAKQAALSGTGFVKISGTTISYDNTSYLPLTGGTLTGNLNGTNITISNSLIAKGGTFNGGASSSGIITMDGLGSDLLMNRADSSNGALITLLTNANEMWSLGMRSLGNDNFYIYNSALLANAVTINSSNSATTFASSVTASALYVSGMTAGSGAIYHTASRLTFANYNTSGTLHFEVNGGNGALTINADKTSSFLGGITVTPSTTSATIVTGGIQLQSYASTNNLIGLNSYFNGTVDKYYDNGFANQIQVNGGVFYFKTAPSGVAGNNITYTTALTIANGGAATFSSSVTAAQLYTNSNAAASGFMQFNYATSNTSSRSWRLANDLVVYGDFAIQQSTTQTGTSFTNLLYINPSGNVGIGTTSPSQGKLVVSNAGPSVIANRETSVGVYSSWNSSDGSVTFFGTDSNHPLAFTTNGSERMRILANGGVSIGKTTNTFASSTRGSLEINGTNDSIMALFSNNVLGGYIFHSGTDMQVLNNISTGSLQLYTNGTERMRITSTGNVGIGTTSPAAKLTVVGATTIIGQTNVSARFSDDINSTLLISHPSGDNTATITGNINLAFATGAVGSIGERMRITSSGNVGIGTTSPNDYSIGSTAKVLQVTGSSYGIVNANAGSVYAWLIADTGAAATGTQSNHDFKIVSNNTERMRIKSNGIINFSNVPTSSAGLSSGDVYKTVAGVLMIV